MRNRSNELKNTIFFTERTNFSKYVDQKKKQSFFKLNAILFENFLKLIITEQKILSTKTRIFSLTERFHWMNDFTERSFTKQNERNIWKMIGVFKNERNQFSFERLKKKRNRSGQSRTMNQFNFKQII